MDKYSDYLVWGIYLIIAFAQIYFLQKAWIINEKSYWLKVYKIEAAGLVLAIVLL